MRGQTNSGIRSTDFMKQAFRNDAYRLDITFSADGSWSYIVPGQADHDYELTLFSREMTNWQQYAKYIIELNQPIIA